ncbi:MAG TPA: hypothetical protein VHP33_08335 [Polyangiaceae bacterium]|nr:hypothetical protein [Polyangiaceae bacterium]
MAKRLAGLEMGLGLALALLGCGESEAEPQSNVTNGRAGSGGSAGVAGSFSLGLGGVATGGVATGGASNAAGTDSGGASASPHVCGGAPEPACPAKVLNGTVVADNAAEWAALEGVTEVNGNLMLMSPLGLDTLSCLEKVSGTLTLDFFAEEAEAKLWGLRNLKSVGGSLYIKPDEGLEVDCGFSRLTSVGGETYATGGSVDVKGWLRGHLDLSALKVVQNLRMEESSLEKVTLPSNTTLTRGQLALIRNAELSEVAGFSGITFKNDGILVEGAYSVKITDNPLLSECRARELAQLLIAAGAPESGVTVVNNLACAQ